MQHAKSFAHNLLPVVLSFREEFVWFKLNALLIPQFMENISSFPFYKLVLSRIEEKGS